MSDARSTAEIVGERLARFADQERTFEWRAFAMRAKEAAQWKCQCCGISGRAGTLAVHHPFYEPHRCKWEYELHEVMVLCHGCHERLHEQLNRFKREVFRQLTPETFEVINGALATGLAAYRPRLLAFAIAEMVASPGSVERFAAAWKGWENTHGSERAKNGG